MERHGSLASVQGVAKVPVLLALTSKGYLRSESSARILATRRRRQRHRSRIFRTHDLSRT